jgi:hypothetical protein
MLSEEYIVVVICIDGKHIIIDSWCGHNTMIYLYYSSLDVAKYVFRGSVFISA